jgi:hypothetical protein
MGSNGGETSSQRFKHTVILLSEIETNGTWDRSGPFAAATNQSAQTIDYRARASGLAEQLLPALGD